ncbi:MAG: hypothetical protein FWC76_01030 [Defluviitaleaceae bacterium]|nr:hypothetical protein [Defluviitaleaceae bacterium]
MLLKLMKHDIAYSAKIFFALGAIAVAIALIYGTAVNIQHATYQQQVVMAYQSPANPFRLFNFVFMFSNILLIPVGMAAIIHIAQFYRKSMFGRVGHLTMTTPVSRNTLLTSKIAVSFTWFVYTIGLVVVMVIIFSLLSPYRPWGLAQLIRQIFSADMVVLGVNIAAIGFAAIALLFFCVTLSHSIIAGKRVNGFLAGFIGLLYAWLYVWIMDMLSRRFMGDIVTVITKPDGTFWGNHTSHNVQLTGLQYGRIVIRQMTWEWIADTPGPMFREAFIDIYFIALTLTAAAIAIAATRYLLKRRISLQ